MRLLAINNYVIVKINQSEESVRSSGLTVPEEREINPFGTVVSVGPQVKEKISEGDKVLIPIMGVSEYRDGLEKYLILLDHQVYAVLHEVF